ncbi:MAG: metallophosphoesterase [Planctomycetales bacterium]|nr:metallophosphoesterase [Planctomycetales bacterium]
MSNWPLRFLHASDLHLEQPLHGVTEIPDSLLEKAIDAPYQAAERLVDQAIELGVDFLVLSGDVINTHQTGPRGVAFFRDQLARLTERRIAVFWLPGKVDPVGNWPTAIPLPDGVQFFSGDRGEQLVYRREDEPAARIVGLGHDAHGQVQADMLQAAQADTFTIGVGYGQIDRTSIDKSRLGYVALGGAHERELISSPPRAVQYAGTHQGRCPSETGAHGATLIDVDDLGNVRTKFIATDVLRWLERTVTIEGAATRERIENKLSEAMRHAQQNAEGRDLMIRWTVETSLEVARRLRRRHIESDLLAWLREGFSGLPAAWSVSVTIEAGEAIPEQWYDEETILGDYLRLAHEVDQNPRQLLDLSEYLDGDNRDGIVAAAAKIKEPELRRRVLAEAVKLGVDLLAADSAGEE